MDLASGSAQTSRVLTSSILHAARLQSKNAVTRIVIVKLLAEGIKAHEVLVRAVELFSLCRTGGQIRVTLLARELEQRASTETSVRRLDNGGLAFYADFNLRPFRKRRCRHDDAICDNACDND